MINKIFDRKFLQTSGLTFDEIASHCKLTNGYAAQLFMNQVKCQFVF